MSIEEKYGHIPRASWFCGEHGVEPTGPAGVCTCPPPQLVDTGTIFASVPAPEPFKAQTVENLANELCVGVEPDQPTVTQDELLTALDELLDSALHDDRCYIHENDTECVCVIGKVRAALPPCGATYRPAHPQRGDRVVTCHRNAHPSSPDRHVF